MTIDVEILDWPASIVANSQMFYAGGQGFDGGFTGGGYASILPEPGGRSFLEMTFNRTNDEVSGRLVSWLISRMRNGAVFRVPIRRTPQLARLVDLGLSALIAVEQSGLPWDEGQPWDSGEYWALDIVGTAPAAAAEGVTQIVVDLAGLNQGLSYGHLIGHKSVTYHIDDIAYAGDVATITITPPLRNSVDAGDLITLRPCMLATALDPDSFKARFDAHRHIRPGSIVMAEALL